MANTNIRSRVTALAAAAEKLRQQSGAEFGNSAPFSLAFLTDQARIPNPEIVARALPKGAAIILRDYRLPHRRALARRLKSICAARRLLLIIGADPDLAQAVGADGLHTPSWYRPSSYRPKSAAPRDMIMTAACHRAEDLEEAARFGADLAFLSPVFPTPSHPGEGHLGAQAFRALAAASPLPVLALGGVDGKNAETLAGPNVVGLGAIGAFCAR